MVGNELIDEIKRKKQNWVILKLDFEKAMIQLNGSL